MVTINRLGLSSALRRCLGTTNVIENPHSAMRRRRRNVKRWRDGQMVLRWLVSAYPDAEKTFRRIRGHKDRWMLEGALQEEAKKQEPKKHLDSQKKVA
ncbi:MAG TPA: hypothetical protein PLQ35_03680 [bacterium]|nr:hypothetical protein [bacterium]HQL61372.1 hypothetical protein [bacterium]